MRRWIIRGLAGVLAVQLLPALVSAQTSTGVVTGSVVDPQGAAIVGATVRLVQERTGVARDAATDGRGDFVFPSVPPERYLVEVEAPGFKKLERRGLALTASERLSVGALKLETGPVAEVISVTSEAPVIQTASQERSAVLGERQIQSLSTQGRDYLNMLKVLPGVSYPDGAGAQALGSSRAPVISGVREDYLAINVDGVVGNNRGTGTTENMINIDAVAEVKVLLSNYQAEYGKNAGAIVNVVTKSGTSDYRGSAYWYKRHESLNANNFFRNRNEEERPRYRFNTMGYNLGGPVPGGLKDRLFFFWSHEIQPNERPSTRNYTVPTLLERRGDFSQTVDTNGRLIVIRDPQTGQPFPGNVIPTGRINTDMQRLLNILPEPNFFDIAVSNRAYNYRITDTIENPVNQEILRLDYTPSERWRLSLRGMAMSVKTQGLATTANTNQWGIAQSYDTKNPNVAFNVSFFPSASVASDLAIGYSGWKETQSISSSELAKLQKGPLGITFNQFNPALNPLGVVPAASFGLSSSANIGFDGRFPMDNEVKAFSISEGLSKVAGAHTLKAGVYFEHAEYSQPQTGTNFAGSLNFARAANNPLDANHAYANALLGNYQTYQEVSSRIEYQPVNQVLEWYAQDNWRLSNRLTLDYGVRFTYDLPGYQKQNVGGNFDPARYDRSKQAVMFEPARNAAGQRVARDPRTGQLHPEAYIGFFVPGSGDPYSGTVEAGQPDYPRSFVESNGVLVAPRVGFAWDPAGDGKTAVRAGFGMFYNSRARSGQAGDMAFNPPSQAQQQVFYGNVKDLQTAGSLLAPSTFRRMLNREEPLPTTYQMSFGVQRNIGFGTVLDVAYSGNLGRNLGQRYGINDIPYGARFLSSNIDPTTNRPLPDNFIRPFYGYGGIPVLDFDGESSYHSLQTQLKHRASKSLELNVAWTWAKAMNYGDDYDAQVATFNDRRMWNYGPAASDRTHTVAVNWVWDLPKASRLVDNPGIKLLFDNWRVSGIYAYATGVPEGIDLQLADAADLTGGGDGTTVVLTGVARLPGKARTFERWFDTSAVRRPARGEIGSGATARRDAFRRPGIDNLELTLVKTVPLKGRLGLQLRAEMYNALNHTQWNGVNTTARFDASGAQINPGFGQVTGAREARIQQLSVRMSF